MKTLKPRKRAEHELRQAIQVAVDPTITVHSGTRFGGDLNVARVDESIEELGQAVSKWAPEGSQVRNLAEQLQGWGDDLPSDENERDERVLAAEGDAARLTSATRTLANQYRDGRVGSLSATLAVLRYYRAQEGGALRLFGAGGAVGVAVVVGLRLVEAL